MGPSATARFYQLLIENCQKQGLKNNDEYPYIVIYNLPVPDLIADQNSKEITLEMIIAGLKKLESFGADFIVIPCNTIHAYIDTFRKAVTVPIISIVEVTVERICAKKIGILGSKTTMKEGIYQFALEEKGKEIILPENMDRVSDVIKKIIGGEDEKEDELFLIEEIRKMSRKGAEAVILGCTELPLIVNGENSPLPVFDTLSILAECSVKEVCYR